MATNEERRKIAERLRDIRNECIRASIVLKADNAEAIVLGGLSLAVCGKLDTPWISIAYRLADLIEPEPECTCHMIWEVPTYGFYNYECSSCGEKFYFAHAVKLKFCPDCGAKVVPND